MPHQFITTTETPRGRAEVRVLATIAAAWPDKEVHYLFGGFVALPKGTAVTCASTLETLWEKLMTGPSPANPVAGSVGHDELPEGPR